ncbi:MAG: VacJ family lipoprotein [Thermodesulfobacteriota bacterium]
MRQTALLACSLCCLLLAACATAPAPRAQAGPVLLAQADAPATDAGEFSDEATARLDALLDEDYEQAPNNATRINDPLEPLNRVFFQFNDKLYFYLLKPTARAYNAVTPEPLRIGVKNAFHNLRYPIRLASCLLQGKGGDALRETGAFLLNSTLGMLGLFDLARNHESLKTPDEDLGQTFGAWGAGHGFYIVLPALGPSSLRDGLGTFGDSYLDPVSHLTPWEHSIAAKGYDKYNNVALSLGDYEAILEAAIDPYVAVRDAYAQHRAAEIRR